MPRVLPPDLQTQFVQNTFRDGQKELELNGVMDTGISRSGGVKVWPVGALLRAIADALEARFNPVAVQGEISGFSRAASGHCYFSLKGDDAQIRCAMFKRTASLLDFAPRDGQAVELRGRLGVYDARGELQLIVESMQQAGQGTLFEQFLQLKAKLDAEGLFANSRKRPLPLLPKAIGVVTSLGAAALHDVVSTLQRRVPHLPVVIYPAAVQGPLAAAELLQALQKAYQRSEVDVVLLVRGGGALEDLAAFNDERLARAITQSPMPVISGVGHETDFTIADFCADVRAPTPTAAAELCAQPQAVWLSVLQSLTDRIQKGIDQQIQVNSQRLDLAAARFSRPSHFVTRQQARLALQAHKLRHAEFAALSQAQSNMLKVAQKYSSATLGNFEKHSTRLNSAKLRLELLNPQLVLERGYAWLADVDGRAITRVDQAVLGQAVRATLTDGTVDLNVTSRRLI